MFNELNFNQKLWLKERMTLSSLSPSHTGFHGHTQSLIDSGDTHPHTLTHTIGQDASLCEPLSLPGVEKKRYYYW